MDYLKEYMEFLRQDEDTQKIHKFICNSLRNKDPIFADLTEFAQNQDIIFLLHRNWPGTRSWNVLNPVSCDAAGMLRVKTVCHIVSVPLSGLRKEELSRKDIIRQAFELAHELGHIRSFEQNDLNALLSCSFMRLSRDRVCPYLELRAFEEGIKIFEDILEKYDAEIKVKQKVKKFFFGNFYVNPEYWGTFAAECVITLKNDRLALSEESAFCPVLAEIRDVLTRLSTCDTVF